MGAPKQLAPLEHGAQFVAIALQAGPPETQLVPLHVPVRSQASSPSVQAPPAFLAFAAQLPVVPSHMPVAHVVVRDEQSFAVPPHDPPEHLSLVVHLLPSSQLALFGAFWQPRVALHVSVVHGLPSSQLSATCAQPVTGSQLSVVQTLLSSQLFVVSTEHVPLKHEVVVQTLPSSHAAPSSFLPYWQVVPLAQTVPAACSQLPGVVHATPQHEPPTQ